jgi:hypothetical protein
MLCVLYYAGMYDPSSVHFRSLNSRLVHVYGPRYDWEQKVSFKFDGCSAKLTFVATSERVKISIVA